jgi:DNA-binding NtrC family response regulator
MAAPAVKDSGLPPAGLKAIAAAAAADAERRAIRQALQATNGNKSAVARLLGIDYKTLRLKMKRYGICRHEFQTG